MSKETPFFSLGLKIFLIVTSLLLFIIAVAFISYIRITRVNEEVIDLSEFIIPITDKISIIDVHVLEQELAFEELIKLYESHEESDEHKSKLFEMFENRGEMVDEEILKAVEIAEKAETTAKNEEDRYFFAQLKPVLHLIEKEHQDFHDHAMSLLAELQKGNSEKAHELESRIEEEEDHFDKEIADIYKDLHEFGLESVHTASEHQKSVLRLNLFLTIAAIILGIFMTFIFTRNLIKPIKELTHAMNQVGEGNYNIKLQNGRGDEISRLSKSFKHMAGELELKDKIKSTFGKYVDPRVVESLISQEQVKTGGVKQTMSVMFSQIDGFSKIIKICDADTQVKLTNKYLSILSKSIQDNHGVLDKYIDTMVMAFWGPPFNTEDDHAVLACKALFGQKQILKEINELLTDAGIQYDREKLVLHGGISTGQLVVGNMGSENSKSYTVLGDTVNIASRLKGAASQYGLPVLISRETMEAVHDKVICRKIDRVKVMGKDESLEIYEPIFLQESPEDSLAILKIKYEEALDYYQKQQWDKSLAAFKECLATSDSDGPSQVFIERIDSLRQKNPGADWDGVWELIKK